MKKNNFTLTGAVVVLFAIALNLHHAGNDYGLQAGTVRLVVDAQTSGGGSGGNGEYVYCILETCHIIKCPESYEWEFYYLAGWIFIGTIENHDCFLKYGIKMNDCSFDWPGYNFVWGRTCEDCKGQCVESINSTSK